MFIQGVEYRRRDLHEMFGGQRQGGISTPAQFPFIMIFTGDSGNEFGYQDGWQSNGVFYYTGEGQKGNMKFIRGNKAIRDHVMNGRDLHLFECVRNGYVKYIGQMLCIGYHTRRSLDRNGNDRDVIVFELISVQMLDNSSDGEVLVSSSTATLSELRQIAFASSSHNAPVSERIAQMRKRSEAIRLYAFKRAQGVCEACRKPAPFMTIANEPYLEVHHLRRLSDGGPDHPEWVAAICPNCHRRAHYGIDARQFNDSIVRYIHEKERDLAQV
ncbi:MAG: HNH endonuclease [Alicyclobacillus sp.]|nr:HNH endonuclease [Alicyclobacillus sp.]